MEALIFKVAFFILIGLAMLGVLTMATVAIVYWLKVVCLWLKANAKTTKAGAAR